MSPARSRSGSTGPVLFGRDRYPGLLPAASIVIRAPGMGYDFAPTLRHFEMLL